jgi:chloramphenicol 3-O phosphotransferase
MIIILNGTSSSGKTSLLKAIQDTFDEPFLDLGIDKFIFAMPERYLDHPLWNDILGLADRAGKTGHQLFSAMHYAILAASRQGMHVVADHVLVEPGWLEECARLFHLEPAWLVGVRCPLEILEEREKSRRNRTLGQARLQFEKVHQPGIYDLEVDTSQLSPAECALKIKELVTAGQPPTAIRKVHQYFARENLKPAGNQQASPPGSFTIQRDAPIPGQEIESLRVAVGWDCSAGTYERILPNAYTHFSIRQDGNLIGFLNVISDGIADAFLVDLMVHPAYQEIGLGTSLVQRAIQELQKDGIRCVEVIFEPQLESFYQKFGFFMLKAGIIDSH